MKKKKNNIKKNLIKVTSIILIIIIGIIICLVINRSDYVINDSKGYNNVFSYIKNQNNVTAVINYCDPKGIKNGEYVLYGNNLTDVIKKLEDSKMIYLDNIISNPCQTELYIRYQKDDKEMHVSLLLEENYVLVNNTDDDTIYKIYDNNFNKKKNSYTFDIGIKEIIKDIIGE